MRLAWLSDVHGNDLALEAVLQDVAATGGVDGYWVVGDLVALGHAPVAVLERLTALPNATFLRGNTDRYVATGERPPPSADDLRQDLALIGPYTEVAQTFAWTQGALSATGWLQWLSTLPLEHRAVLPDGTRVLAVHAAPGRDDGPGLAPEASDDDLHAVLADCRADLVVVGHTHRPLDRAVDGVRAFNLGSVSNPTPPDLRASYAILEADAAGHRLRHRRVDYDHAAVVDAIWRVRHPGWRFIVARQQPGT